MPLKRAGEEALRKRAEDSIASGAIPRRVRESDDPLHGLLVHQAELEMQNEALRDAQIRLTESERRYRDLFDNAPVGYLVLDAKSSIQSANPSACELLGSRLVGTRLTKYLLAGDTIEFDGRKSS